MSDKNVIAYFKTREKAEAAASKLKALRAIDVSVDEFSRYPGEGGAGAASLMSGDFPGLASVTLDASVTSRDEGILMAADPSASGISDGGSPVITGYNYVLAAVMKEENHKQALQVVEQSGGYM